MQRQGVTKWFLPNVGHSKLEIWLTKRPFTHRFVQYAAYNLGAPSRTLRQ